MSLSPETQSIITTLSDFM